MIKVTHFPDIGQFRNVVHTLRLRAQYAGKDENDHPIYDESRPLLKVRFHGTVKMHGTNSSICFNGDDIWFQSRTDVVMPGKDNAGFATSFSHTETIARLRELNTRLREQHGYHPESTLALFGEWCGKGIQKGTGLNQLPKMFVLFGLKEAYLDETPSRWHPIAGLSDPDIGIHNILDYPTFELEVDLADPQSAVDEIDRLTAEVERRCPVANAFGVEGIGEGIGEGIVWTAVLEDGTRARFKSKGEKHSVTVKREKTPVDIEKLESVRAFVEYAVPVPRLEQGMAEVFTAHGIVPEVQHTGTFLKWVVADVLKEELDTLVENRLNAKDVQGEISRVARNWFFAQLDQLVFEK